MAIDLPNNQCQFYYDYFLFRVCLISSKIKQKEGDDIINLFCCCLRGRNQTLSYGKV